mmetsp:Transcript_37652/g.70160  ORF Transcript_37652/g.70160 Transcript_37652/m.70160 type:complete len:132 (-) Transcript_37652:34-429(-)
MGLTEDFTKGEWKHGLFAIKCPDCLVQNCCAPCALAQIHEKLGNPGCTKMQACLCACCVPYAAEVMLVQNGQKTFPNKETLPLAIAKCWCCAACYLHQQYKEHGCVEDFGQMIKTATKPSQQDMASNKSSG